MHGRMNVQGWLCLSICPPGLPQPATAPLCALQRRVMEAFQAALQQEEGVADQQPVAADAVGAAGPAGVAAAGEAAAEAGAQQSQHISAATAAHPSVQHSRGSDEDEAAETSSVQRLVEETGQEPVPVVSSPAKKRKAGGNAQ